MRRNYIGFWLLLVVAFAAIICVSAFSPVRIFGYELKDSGISGVFRPSEPASGSALSDSIIEDTTTVAREQTVSIPAPLDTASKRILFIGDSMLDGLYPRLAAYTEENGHELYVVIWYSSTSEVWGRSDKLRDYISSLNPDYIFISLGANELFVKDIAAKREKYIKNILGDIGDIPYLWIGPPNWKEDTGINDLIEANTARGCFFRSDGMHFERKKDGAHPTSSSSVAWMDSIARWMPEHSSHPILMKVPDKKSGHAKRVFVHNPQEK